MKVLDDLVTYEGNIELTQQHANDMLTKLAPKVIEAAQSTEKTTLFLAENIKRLGLDFISLSKTAENISDSFKTLLKNAYVGKSESEDSTKYFYKASMEVFSAYAAHL